MNRGTAIMLFLILLLGSCTEDDSCQSGLLDITSLEDLGCANSANLVKIVSGEEFELIRNQETYDALITGPCNPSIDWSKNDLIAGMLLLSNGLVNIDQHAYYNCSANILDITIMVYLNETTVAQQVFFGFLIPKLDNAETPFVNFETF